MFTLGPPATLPFLPYTTLFRSWRADMPQILMPALSPTMEEGKLAKWLVKVGDSVKSGDVLAEIETDKATMEVESVDEGVVKELRSEEHTSELQSRENLVCRLLL